MKASQYAFRILTLIIFLAHTSALKAQQPAKWKGFDQVNIQIAGHEAYYVKPAKPLAGNPWVWRASFPDWHTDMDSILLAKGFYVTYINVDDQYGSPAAMQAWDKLYDYLIDSVKLAPKAALEAVSRGGLYSLGWAKRNPDKVSCIYAETPVYDIKSWPGGKGKGRGDTAAWRQFKQVFNFSEEQALNYRDNPIDHLEGLASFKVPVLNVIGPNDQLAPNAENTFLFAQRYAVLGGPVSIYPVTEGPQELFGRHIPIKHAPELADFIIRCSFPVSRPLPYTQYIKLRSGLPGFYHAVKSRPLVTVAFLGGSITYNPGWRDKVCAYLKEVFPQTHFHFIAAGIPSLGSVPHAFRVQQDVLDSSKVDLLFLETAVNDRANSTDSLAQVLALEGIVRHVKKNNPAMDIVMMGFADPEKTRDYDKGITPPEIANQELVAGYYNLPSINLAKEVRDKLNAHEFSWADDFKDLHPAPFGQELYFANIKSLLVSALNSAATVGKGDKANVLPKPLNSARFENGRYESIRKANIAQGWSIDPAWKPADQLATREGFVNVPMLVADKPGAAFSFQFNGTAVGIAIISGGDAGMIEYSVDGAPFSQTDLFTQWSNSLHLPWYVLLGSGLKNTRHVLKVRISEHKNKGSKGNACRIVHFLVNG